MPAIGYGAKGRGRIGWVSGKWQSRPAFSSDPLYSVLPPLSCDHCLDFRPFFFSLSLSPSLFVNFVGFVQSFLKFHSTRRIFKSFLSFSLLNSCQLSISPIIHIYLFQFLKILFLQNTKRYIYLYIYINDSSKI